MAGKTTERLLLSAAVGALLLTGRGLGQQSQPRAVLREETAAAKRATRRQPVALAAFRPNSTLYVANRASGTISVIDSKLRKVVAEFNLGTRLADLVVDARHNRLLAVDEADHQLLVVQARNDDHTNLQMLARVPVARYPVSVVVSAQGDRCYVASLWSRQITAVDLPAAADGNTDSPVVVKKLKLPFEPRRQLLIEDRSLLLVADAFAGKLAVIDLDRLALRRLVALPAQNIRGLAIGPEQTVLLSHQRLSRLATTSRENVHWGNLLTNNLRSLSLAALTDEAADPLTGSELIGLGDVGRGAGDPAAVQVLPSGKTLVCLAGVGRLGIGRSFRNVDRDVEVQRRPTAMLVDGRRAWVVNTLSDSLSLVQLDDPRASVLHIPLGPRRELSGVERGEQLFFDAGLSLEGWFSCHSCHSEGHTSGGRNDNLGDGSYGAPKRILSLLGIAETGPWAWNGRI